MNKSYFDSPDVRHVLPIFSSPAAVVDAEVIRERYRAFVRALPGITPFYSVKTNPHPLVIDTLIEFKAHFDAPTIDEIMMLLERGVDPGGILHTHPVKTAAEIEEAVALGINAFTLDSLDELKRLSLHAPKAHLFLRLGLKANASLYDYKRKFGANVEEAQEILDYAEENQLRLAGISFMVGSQSMAAGPWEAALERVLELFNAYYETIPTLRIVNIGSGFPLQYRFDEEVPTLPEIAKIINDYRKRFPKDVQFIAEPGRCIAGPAVVYKAKVIRRIERGAKHWLYTNMNVYSGLIEIIESGGEFRYELTSDADGRPDLFMVSGQTLDPDDMLGLEVPLPGSTTEGSILTIRDAGAYTLSFFTNYHNLPHPSIITVDSKYAHNVSLATGTMGISGLRANRAFSAGDILFRVSGYFCDSRSRTTFQVDIDKHIEPTLFGAFLNHSCDPNVGVRTNKFGYYDVIARRHISAGEDIAADYAMFEYETGPMSVVKCLCGAQHCRTYITGYKDLPAEQRKAYKDLTAAYLLEHYAHQTGIDAVLA